jgi:F420-dependent oxidoreductase-like protein
MRLGLQLGYWGAGPPDHAQDLVDEAERLGLDAVFAAEAWGSDALTPLAWYGSRTSRVRLGTAIVQMSARTPTGCAMHALTLDHLSGGRAVLGLGVSGPQVVEGWYGAPFAKPLARTREYVSVVRQVLAREAPVVNDGVHYPLPYSRDDATGLGKPLKPITHPLRADLPIWLGAEGPRNVALAAEIADGWLPLFYAPRLGPMYEKWLAEGFARPGARRTREEFEVCATAQVVVTDDRERTLEAMKPYLALYIGGMGSKQRNFHRDVFVRMGYEAETEQIQQAYLAGEKDKAAAAVPDRLVEDITLLGSAERVREDVARWEEAGVSMLLVTCQSVGELRAVAEAVLG